MMVKFFDDYTLVKKDTVEEAPPAVQADGQEDFRPRLLSDNVVLNPDG